MLALRPTTTGDLDAVVAMETASDTAEWLCETGRPWHQRALADPDQEHLIADDGGSLAGFVVLAGRRRSDGVVELRRMVLGSALRGAGMGRQLLEAAVARAYELHSARTVWLDVKAHNLRARALYESARFTVTEVRASAVAEPDGSASDLIVMTHQRPAGRVGGR